MEKRKALGRGLQALIPETKKAEDIGILSAPGQAGAVTVNSSDIQPGRFQPRSAFKAEKLGELIASIKEKGIVQPILVRKSAAGYEIIAGERRFRAARELGLRKIPVIVKDVDDASAMQLALVENIQREDLNPIEEAKAYKRLIEEFGFTQEQTARAVGRDRSSVANTLRLLSLPDKIQQLVLDDIITMGHARALLTVSDRRRQERICDKLVRKGLSVREAERLVKPHAPKRAKSPYSSQDVHTQAAEEELRQVLGTKVRIFHGKKRGKIVVDYYSLSDLNRIIGILRGGRNTEA